MGQAKRRGTFEERKAQATEKMNKTPGVRLVELSPEQIQAMENLEKLLPKAYEKLPLPVAKLDSDFLARFKNRR